MADMTTNDKPVWIRQHMTEPEYWIECANEAEALDAMRSGLRVKKLYARPQPAAPQVPEGWRVALTETDTDLNRLLSNIIDAEKRDPKWEGMADIVRGWIARNRVALATPPAPEQPKPEQPDPDKVICPACCHQFRAIPVNVQAKLFAAEQPKPDRLQYAINSAREAWVAVHGNCGMCTVGDAPVNGLHRGRYKCGNGTTQPKPAGDVEALLARYEAWIKTIPVGAENNTRGASSYNWHMAALYQLRRLAAQPAQGEGEK